MASSGTQIDPIDPRLLAITRQGWDKSGLWANTSTGTVETRNRDGVPATIALSSATQSSVPVAPSVAPTISVGTTVTISPATNVVYNDPNLRVSAARLVDTPGSFGSGRYKSVLGLTDTIGLFSYEFTYTGQTIEIAFRSGDGVRIWADGLLVAEWIGRADGAINYYKVDFGSAAVRHIQAEMSGNSLAYGIVKEQTAALFPPPGSCPMICQCLSNSFMFGTNGTAGSSLLRSEANHVTRMLGMEHINQACGGTDFLNPGSGAGTVADRWARDNPTVDVRPRLILIHTGYNDRNSLNVSAYTQTALYNAYVAAFGAGGYMRTTYPNAIIVMVGPQAPNGTTAVSADFTNVASVQQAACAASRVFYANESTGQHYDFDGTLVYTSSILVTDLTAPALTGTDSVHPTILGHNARGRWMESVVRRALRSSTFQKA